MKLFFNTVYNLSENCFWNISKLCCTAIVKTSCYIRDISVGSNTVFIGLTKIKRGNKSSITIGESCIFRSAQLSNLIGINRPCIFTAMGATGSTLVVGNNCGFSGTVIGCFATITLGNNVRCGANTLITDSDWHHNDERLGGSAPVTIEDNVFMGMNVTVLKGVIIGENSVIGAGSVVVSDIPPNVLAAGNPCRVIKPLHT